MSLEDLIDLITHEMNFSSPKEDGSTISWFSIMSYAQSFKNLSFLNLICSPLQSVSTASISYWSAFKFLMMKFSFPSENCENRQSINENMNIFFKNKTSLSDEAGREHECSLFELPVGVQLAIS